MSRYDDICATLTSAPRRWLVTGAAGFIGSALLERLLSLGQTVVGLDNFATGSRENIADVLAAAGDENAARFHLIEGDVCDAACCRQACEQVDIVLHHAALASVPWSIDDPLAAHEANVGGFLRVLLAARDAGVKRVIYASSSAVYGDSSELPAVESQGARPLSPYAATKLADELYADVVQRTYGVELIGLRYFNIYGPRQDPRGPYAAVIPKWIRLLLEGKPGVIYGAGGHSRDFCYVADAVQANLLAALAEPRATAAVYNVGSGERTTLTELYARVCDGLAAAVPALEPPPPVHGSPRQADVEHSQADISKLARRLGFAPRHDLRTGMIETARWFARQEAR